ncbi:MAG: HAD family hydrolase [Planctomycetes bacterium]|nr:HAD family hydrolase [Planctomycetota bacterium]
MPKVTIIFVHGLGGDPKTTWGKFPELIKSDPDFKDCGVDSFEYTTSLFRFPWSKKVLRVQTIAEALRTFMNVRHAGATDIILVCHSLGGLVGRRYLLDERKRGETSRVRGLLLYAVPNDGSGLAEAAGHVSWTHNQLRQLCKDSDFLVDLNNDWVLAGVAKDIKIRFVVAEQDRVVSEASAKAFWGNTNVDLVIGRGHRDLVKPTGEKDMPYLIFQQFARAIVSPGPDPVAQVERFATPVFKARAAGSAVRKGYRVIAFDLDGTLLRGCDFSWTVVWKHLGFQKAVYDGARHNYRHGKTTYQEWCDLACKEFRSKGLRRADFTKIMAGIQVTKNLDSTVKSLRNAGFITALISGGMDTFVEERIPNAADELFDYICINKIRFDNPSGLIAGVESTPFDFEGKLTALAAICKRHGCTLNEAVFVGEGYNDEHVINGAGLSIAYPPGETAIDAGSKVKIEEDDLSKILEHVL